MQQITLENLSGFPYRIKVFLACDTLIMTYHSKKSQFANNTEGHRIEFVHPSPHNITLSVVRRYTNIINYKKEIISCHRCNHAWGRV